MDLLDLILCLEHILRYISFHPVEHALPDRCVDLFRGHPGALVQLQRRQLNSPFASAHQEALLSTLFPSL